MEDKPYSPPPGVLSGIRNARIPHANVDSLLREYISAWRVATEGGVIDLKPAGGGKAHAQDNWIQKYNSQEGEFEGKRMIIAPDVYRAGKSGLIELVRSLRNGFCNPLLVTGDRDVYIGDCTHARIIHNYGSTIPGVQPIESIVEVPVYRDDQDARADRVLKDNEGIKLAQARFGTTYGPDEIGEALVFLSGMKLDEIYLRTPLLKERARYPERAVVFSSILNRFFVYGIDPITDNGGRSRGVLIKQLEAAQK